jgi:hypothetical protein
MDDHHPGQAVLADHAASAARDLGQDGLVDGSLAAG